MLIDIIKSHVNMIILHVDIIYFACGEQENATITDFDTIMESNIKYYGSQKGAIILLLWILSIKY